MDEELPWNQKNRITGFLYELDDAPSQIVGKEVLESKLVDLESQLAEVSTEMRRRMTDCMNKVAERDWWMDQYLERGRKLENESKTDVVVAATKDLNLFEVNASMMAKLTDFGVREALEELIEMRYRIRGQIRETKKMLRKFKS